MDGIKNEIETIDSEINELNNQNITLKQEIKSLDKPLSNIQKVENKCPVCQSDITEDKKNELIDMYEETISNDSKKINENNEIQQVAEIEHSEIILSKEITDQLEAF